MTIERWGAFSVIDHKNDRQLAAEVLLYDRLLIPTPMDWDRDRWAANGWDPDGLDRKLEELGEIAIRANWDQDRQKDWATQFGELRADQRDINSALQVTRRVLIEQERNYRPHGVEMVEAFAAYQSQADFEALDPLAAAPGQREAVARVNLLLSHRLAVPDEADDAETLKRALDLAHDPAFRRRRSSFYEWQHGVLARGHLPSDAAAEMAGLAREYGELVQRSGREFRWETVALCCSIAVAGLALAAGLCPGSFAAMGAGPLAGAQVVQLGGFASGAALQIARHIAGKAAPDDRRPSNVSGAMFHQIESQLGWELR